MSNAIATFAASTEPQHTTDREAGRFVFWTTFFLVSIWALLLGAMSGWIHPAFLLLCPWLYVRFELYAHELLHCRSGKQLNPILRLMMVAQSVVHMDYDGYRLYHLDHHRFLGTRDDPEHYLVSSSTWGALIKSLFCIEVGTLRHLRLHRRSFKWTSWLELGLQAGVFPGLLVWNWQVFLIYFAVMRGGIGVEISILIWHDAHHDSRRVAGRCLHELSKPPAAPAPAPHFPAPAAPRERVLSATTPDEPPA